LDAAGDSTLILLMVLAAINTGSGIYKDPGHGWIDGVAIFVAVFIIIAITSGNNYSKEK
jgi:hypothetical protein